MAQSFFIRARLFIFIGVLLSQIDVGFGQAAFLCDDDFDCAPHGTCGNDLKCLCDSGYVGNQCELSCPIGCQNGGRCIMIDNHGGFSQENEFRCDCPETHTGGLCHIVAGSDSNAKTATQNKTNNDKAIGIGIGVGVGVGFLILGLVSGLVIRNRRKANRKENDGPNQDNNGDPAENEDLPSVA